MDSRAAASKSDLHVVSWNLTARCNLRCAHCYLDASSKNGRHDLDTEACLGIIEELAAENPRMLLILTGGEPLLRRDLPVISHAAADRGMTVVVGSNATTLDSERARELKECGVAGMGISLDSAPGPQFHDRLRGMDGAWRSALSGIKACKDAGLPFLVQTSVFRDNVNDLPEIAKFAAALGAHAWNVYFLVCTGRGQRLTDLSAQEYEATLKQVRELQRAYAPDLLIAVRCAPQFRRVVAQGAEPERAFHSYPSGCPAATNYARVGPRGEVTPCPYLPTSAGTIGESSFRELWRSADLFLRLRDRSQLQGRCGVCTYRDTCGGCRARALAIGDNIMAEDPSCVWEPQARKPAPAVPEATFALPDQATMPWVREAVERLDRVPSFLRGLVVRRVEAETLRRGQNAVTPRVMKEMRARMKGAAPHDEVNGMAIDNGHVAARRKV